MWENLYENLRNDTEIRELIRMGNANLGVLGYTDHSEAHTRTAVTKAIVGPGSNCQKSP